MIRLGLRLTLRSGREALTRFAVTAVAVAIGVAVLLAVLGDYHAYETGEARPCWECTRGVAPPAGATGASGTSAASLSGLPPNAELWNYSVDFYDGRRIERLDVAGLGGTAPVPPGISKLPAAGQYFASPAMAALLAATPRDQLADRFPGAQAGVVGEAALTAPDELVIVVGYSPAQLAAIPETKLVERIDTAAQPNSTSSLYRLGFGLGAIAMLLPLLVFIGTATRLSAARREERYAALRLVGAKARQINLIASLDAALAAALGALLGAGAFLLARPEVARVSVTGSPVFGARVVPTVAQYVAVLVGVPAVSAAAAVWSLRRVRISPLGVSRRTTPPPPLMRRIIPLLIGLVVFVLSVGAAGSGGSGGAAPGLAVLALILVMTGLIIAGPWLTMKAARLLAAVASGAPSLLAARRLADNPRAAFRSVNGLMLAVFVGTALSVVISTGLGASTGGGHVELANVLRVQYGQRSGDAAQQTSIQAQGQDQGQGQGQNQGPDQGPGSQQLINTLNGYQGASAIPIYRAADAGSGQPTPDHPRIFDEDVISCADLAKLPALGQCKPGEQAVRFSAEDLFTDNPLGMDLPIVHQDAAAYAGNLSSLRLGSLLVETANQATLERVRTYLATHLPPFAWDASLASGDFPQTFGEVAQIRDHTIEAAQRVIYIMIGLTLLVAGCSLAVAMGGGLLERKRPFTLLRLSGARSRVLYRTVLLESLLPLAAAAVVAWIAGFAVAVPTASALARGAGVRMPGGGYYLTMGIGLLVCLAVVFSSLPLLGRLTASDNARFE